MVGKLETMSFQNYLAAAEAKISSSNQHYYTMAVRLVNDATCTKN